MDKEDEDRIKETLAETEQLFNKINDMLLDVTQDDEKNKNS